MPDNAPAAKAVLRISASDMTAIRVRVFDPNHPPPQFLYQTLPQEALPLMTSIPQGTSAVSIPQQNGRFPLLPAFPDPAGKIVVVYVRRSNGRYEASEILCRGESFQAFDFPEIASQWLARDAPRVPPADSQYGYFTPDKEQWGTILRDGGFTVFDPSQMEPDLTAAMLRQTNSVAGSGIVARIPVSAGGPPIFTQVELPANPDLKPDTAWISFIEWGRLRAIRSRPPIPLVPLFKNWLRVLSNESGFVSWNFRKGMYFGDPVEWWGHRNRRRTLHEGIDFSEGSLAAGTPQNIPEGAPVRSIAAGEIVASFDDFLNKTVVVRHSEIVDDYGSVLHTLFSHIQPERSDPRAVMAGDLLGTVRKAKSAGAAAHLHLTGVWIPDSIQAHAITMDMITPAFAPIVLINFNSLLAAGR